MEEEKKEKFDNYAYQQQYIKENVKFVHVPMNMKFPDEKKLFDFLTDHAKETGEKKATYIKRLIREDMEGVARKDVE